MILELSGHSFERSQRSGAHDGDCHLKLKVFRLDHANGASCVAPNETFRKQAQSIARFDECKLQMHVVDFGCDRRGWSGFVENAEKRSPQRTAGRIENPLRRGHRLPCWRPRAPRSTFLDDHHAIRGDNVDKERRRQTMGIRQQHDREIELSRLDFGDETPVIAQKLKPEFRKALGQRLHRFDQRAIGQGVRNANAKRTRRLRILCREP